MNYRLDHKNKVFRLRFVAQIVILFIGIAILALLATWFARFSHVIARGINTTSTLTETTANVALLSMKRKSDLIEMIVVQQKNKDYASLLRDRLSVVEKERNLLQSELGRLQPEEPRPVTIAAALTNPSNTPYGTWLIDQGSSSGVSKGDVVHAEGVLLGHIIDVYSDTSLVQPYSSVGIELEGILSDSRTAVRLKGQGGNTYRIELLRDISVEIGDYVYDRSVGRKVLAEVVHVTFDTRDPFKTVTARTPLNPSALRYVIVSQPAPLAIFVDPATLIPSSEETAEELDEIKDVPTEESL